MPFSFDRNYVLENKKAIVRPLVESDFENLLPYSLNEPELWKYSAISAAGKENLKKYLDIGLQGRNAGSQYPFLIIDKNTGHTAGCTRFYEINLLFQTTLLGYTFYGKAFQGTGLNKAVKYLLLEFAFEQMKMERVEFRADNNNTRSIAAMKSIGCTVEGILRNHQPISHTERRDSIILSILKKEWFGSVKEALLNKIS